MEHVTRHARTRMQQRGIRPAMLEALLDYGRAVRASGEREAASLDWCCKARFAEVPATPDQHYRLRPERGSIWRAAAECQAVEGTGSGRLGAGRARRQRNLQNCVYGSVCEGDLRAA